MPPRRPTTRSSKKNNEIQRDNTEREEPSQESSKTSGRKKRLAVDAEAELMSMEIEISPNPLNTKETSRQKSRKKNAETRQNEDANVEDLDEMRKLLQDIKIKQQNFESLRNEELNKNEQSIKEFKNLVKQLESDFQKETEKNKRLESEIKHLREQVKNIENYKHTEDVVTLKEQVKRLELELKQECENSKKLTAKLSKTSVSRKLTPLELDQKSREMQEQISLYSEMSNLLIQNVKVISQDEKSFKCLHSGRNGTLEFKLTFKGDEAHYEPSLQPDRDADLMAILPDYLKEPIDFKKESLDLFFWRILDFLQKSRDDDDEN